MIAVEDYMPCSAKDHATYADSSVTSRTNAQTRGKAKAAKPMAVGCNSKEKVKAADIKMVAGRAEAIIDEQTAPRILGIRMEVRAQARKVVSKGNTTAKAAKAQ